MSTLLWLLTEAGLVLCWLVTPWAPAPWLALCWLMAPLAGWLALLLTKEAVAGTAHLPRDGGEG